MLLGDCLKLAWLWWKKGNKPAMSEDTEQSEMRVYKVRERHGSECLDFMLLVLGVTIKCTPYEAKLIMDRYLDNRPIKLNE